MLTITVKEQDAIRDFLKNRHISFGIGDETAACSIASINLALYGMLTDAVPPCMSAVIGRWIIDVQDAMPDDMRNSVEWRALLPLAAGTGHKHEKERYDILLAWLWNDVLPQVQPLADQHGFGDAWRSMCVERTDVAARDAARAAFTAASAAAYAAHAAAIRATYAADAAVHVFRTTADAAHAAHAATDAARAVSAADAAPDAFWRAVNPCAVLARLIEVKQGE